MATSAAPAVRATGGPPLWAPIGAYAVLTVVGAALYPGSGPATDPAVALETLRAHRVLADVSALLIVASAAPLAVWTAAVTHRLWVLGTRVTGPVIGFAGGMMAVFTLLTSGLAGWVAASAAAFGDAPAVATASLLSFAAGGVGFVLGSALLLAGVAVPSGLLGLLPRPFAIAGVVLAVLGALAPLGLLTPVLFPVLPVVRFGGLLWFVAAAVLLPRR